jgi:hypothetical protein
MSDHAFDRTERLLYEYRNRVSVPLRKAAWHPRPAHEVRLKHLVARFISTYGYPGTRATALSNVALWLHRRGLVKASRIFWTWSGSITSAPRWEQMERKMVHHWLDQNHTRDMDATAGIDWSQWDRSKAATPA